MTLDDQEPVILDKRFVLSAMPPRRGGMAEVFKAMDIRTGRDCAIKRFIETPDTRISRESFYREQKALQDLKHPNIVELIDVGYTDAGQPYLALEWVDHNLEDWVSKEGPLSWQSFWTTIGKPLLDAIKTAQAARWVHRDIKPKNVLVNTAGVPKLSDYGIARDFSQVFSQYTLREFNTKPYTPPETDDGSEASFARDVFSWAILAGYCVTGREPSDYGEIHDWLGSCDGAPVEVLQRAGSISRERRQRYAALLLQEIEEWDATQDVTSTPQCFVRLLPTALDQIRNLLGVSESQAKQAIHLDFAEVQGARPDPSDSSQLRLYGASWMLIAKRSNEYPGLLDVPRSRFIGPAEAERQRDAGFSGPIAVNFDMPAGTGHSQNLDALFAEASAGEKERELRWVTDPDRIFRAWHAYLTARYEFEGSKASALRYVDAQVNGQTVSVTTIDPLPADIGTQDRIVRFGQGNHVAVEVRRVNGDELTLSVVYGEASRFPRQGLLEINTVRAEKALDRQRQALNAVMHRRSVDASLRDLIVDPSIARHPTNVVLAEDPGTHFDPDKRQILSQALNLSQVMTVEGPPGTGKTRLIEEIIVQYLRKFPRHRVLLSSQTHVALDNVIERIRHRDHNLGIVRVGRYDDERISAGAAELLLERKADEWSRSVRRQAQLWLSEWAAENNVDPQEVRAGMLALRLGRLLGDLAEVRSEQHQLSELGEQLRKVAQEAEDSVELDTFSSDTIAIEAEELAARTLRLKSQLSEVREQLAQIGDLAEELSKIEDASDLEAFGGVLLGDTEAHRECRARMELQDSWLNRVGKSSDFHAAILSSANVVAATCIGLAGVKGIENVAFDLCIVDEASKATATEILVPLARSRRAILVGDPKQLPPFFEQNLLQSASVSDFRPDEIQRSVFDRFLTSLPAECRGRLRHQHRMYAPIGNMISDVFYEGWLINEKLKPSVEFPSFPKPITWLDTSELPDRSERRSGTSFSNVQEARAIRNALRSLAFVASNRKGARYSVAIIAGYQAQVTEIESAIMDLRGTWEGLDVTVNTVDAFQGSEADVCIYSVVRSNPRGKVGFLREPARLNVALSRGRDLLIIVGDHSFCSSLGAELAISDVVKYGFEHAVAFEIRAANVS
jgi:hypothetical protein